MRNEIELIKMKLWADAYNHVPNPEMNRSLFADKAITEFESRFEKEVPITDSVFKTLEFKYTSKLELPADGSLCIVKKLYKSNTISFIQLLTFNEAHGCWDNEHGDEYDCEIHSVECWAYVPEI